MDLPVIYSDLTLAQKRGVRAEYTRRQGNKCQFCNESLDGPPHRKVREASISSELFPPGFFKHPVHLHHDHDTGWTIGATHSRCNAYSFEYYDQ